MKTIKKINKIALIVTFVLYLTYFLGLLSQIFLGFIQLTFSLFLAIKYFTKSRYARRHLLLYWCLVFIEFSVIILFVNNGKTSNDFHQILIFSIFPIIIALYFTTVLNKLVRNHENDN
jgi:hypothetical protein